jgi:transcriptional regulator with XRE-family HTH domain
MPSPLTDLVSGQVRAEMARARLSGTQLARLLGVSHPYLSRRLNGAVAFDTDDLHSISEALGVAVVDLMRTPERAA